MKNSRLVQIQNWSELAQQANWSVATLAKLCGVSRENLRQYFTNRTGSPPGHWLAVQIQHRAVELLHTGSSIKTTALCLGYKQPSNFTRKFKDFWGVCPSLPPPLPSDKSQNGQND
jgi:AraC-like DNA-binding protein